MVFMCGIALFVITILIVQSVMLYKVYVSNWKVEIPQIDKESKEWIAFVDLFRYNKIHNGYVVSYFENKEEFMLRFEGFGTSHGYQKGKFLLGNVWFECDGVYDLNGEEVPGRVASYDLNVNNIVGITPIEEYYGEYGNTGNEYYVICTLKSGNMVQIIFNYKEEIK